MSLTRNCRGWLAAGLFLYASLSAGQAAAGEIRGTITEAGSDLTLPEVSIFIESNNLSRDILSGVDGFFSIADLPGGSYRLEFVAFGFLKYTKEVELGQDEVRVLDVPMILDAVEIEDLLVVGKTADIESDLQTGFVNLDAQTLDAIPGIVEPDPLRALQILPGVQAASDISSGLYIRGGGPDQTLVLMDGVTVYNPTHAFGFFSTFSNDVVDDVSLYKGAYPAEYGGRLGAVLDVGMKKPDSDKIRGKAGISTISARVFLEGRLGQDHWLVSGRRSYLEPLLSAVRTEENPIPEYYFYDMNLAYVSERGGGRTIFQFYNGRDEVSADAGANTNFDLSWGNTVAMLRHERFFTDQLEARFTLSNSRYTSQTDAEILATEFAVDNTLNDLTLSGVLDYQASQQHRLNLGLGYSWYDFKYQQSFNRSLGVDYGSQPGELALFLEDRWFADDLTTLRTGLRYRFIDDGDRSLLEPRISFSRRVRPDLRLKLGGGIYNQYLQLVATEGFSAGDFYLPIDESAKIGRSHQLVLGADWEPGERDLISLEVYMTDLQDLVEFDNQAVADETDITAEELFVTRGKGYARGVELFLRHGRDRWTGWLGYTLGWTERNFPELNGGEAFPPKYGRRHDLNALLAYQAGKWKLAASFRYATGQAYTPAAARYYLEDPASGGSNDSSRVLSAARNSARLLSYHRLDVSARRPFGLFGLPAEVVIEVFNIYNRRNEWFVQYDTDEEVTVATMVRMLPVIPSVGVNFAF